MKRVILCLAFSFICLVPSRPQVAIAASFDCSKASGWIEKAICTNSEISDADDALDLKYRELLGNTKEKEGLIKSQRRWLKKRNAVTSESMLFRVYEDRLIEFAPVSIPIQSITSSCGDFTGRNGITGISDCQVSAYGLIGTVSGRSYYYAIYCMVPDYASPSDGKCNSETSGYWANRGLAVFYKEGTSSTVKLFMDRGTSDLGLYRYERPEIVTHPFGTLLYVPNRLDGTGHYNESEYYLWNTVLHEWELIDSDSWLKEAREKIPAGDFDHGIWPEMTAMTADVYLKTKDDPYCCPSGGVATVSLTVKNKKFVITSVRIRKEEP